MLIRLCLGTTVSEMSKVDTLAKERSLIWNDRIELGYQWASSLLAYVTTGRIVDARLIICIVS